jgi:uncharacterized tellurite resistance protein B-like protein
MAGFIDSVLGLFGRKKDPNNQQQKTQETVEIKIPFRHNADSYQNAEPVSSIPDRMEINQNDTDYLSVTVHGHPVYIPPVTSTPISGMKWAGSTETIYLPGGFLVKNPLTYWSSTEYPEASCIVTGLKVINYHQGKILPPLPYWPQYSAITPAQKGKYLSWLSRGRNDDLDEIGYAFIFFYGLERRAIIEKTDHGIILDEVRRLLARYPVSGSFNSYLNQFMAYVVGSHLSEMEGPDIKKYFPDFDNLNESPTKVIMSWHWMNNLPVPWNVCYSLMVNSRNIQRTNIPRKAPALLKQLFRKKFYEQFPEGIPFSSEYEQFQLNYRPASASLLQYVGYSGRTGLIEPLVLPIPSLGSQPFETVRMIWAECIDELKPAVNRLNKSEGKITGDVYTVLPSSLKTEIAHPDLVSWNSFIIPRKQEDGIVILQVSDLAGQLGIEKRESLTSNQSKSISSTVRDLGWILIPDLTINGTSFKWTDSVAIIPTGGKNDTLSELFPAAALIFEITHGIAASDDTLSDDEDAYVQELIANEFALNPLENECIKGLKKILEIQPPSLSRIGRRLNKYLNAEQKILLSNFLGEIVLLDNKFVKKEQKALKTVFKAMEVKPSVSDELIRKLLIGYEPDRLVTVQKAGKASKGEIIPPQVIKPEFTIDKEKLRQTLEDTRAVQGILASVFDQEQEEMMITVEPEVKIPPGPVTADAGWKNVDLPFPPDTLPSLDVKYISMLHDIMKSGELSQDEFTGLAKKYSLMPRAAFDDINTWADEELGDFLLEESESRIVINYQK